MEPCWIKCKEAQVTAADRSTRALNTALMPSPIWNGTRTAASCAEDAVAVLAVGIWVSSRQNEGTWAKKNPQKFSGLKVEEPISTGLNSQQGVLCSSQGSTHLKRPPKQHQTH